MAEAEQLLRACPDDDAHRYVALSLFAGLRPVEVAALRWEDITEQRDTLMCRGKAGLGAVPLSANVLAWLHPPHASLARFRGVSFSTPPLANAARIGLRFFVPKPDRQGST